MALTPARRERIGQLYDRIGGRLAAVTSGKYGVPHDVAADAVQDVFIDLIEKDALAARVEAMSAVDAFRYLLTATFHRVGREMRRRATLETRPLDVIESLMSTHGLTTATRQPFEIQELIQQAVKDLRSPYREVLAGLLIQHLDAPQLATELGRSVNTIYQQTHRGLQMLRDRLDELLAR